MPVTHAYCLVLSSICLGRICKVQRSRDTCGLAWGLKLAHFSPTLGTQTLPHVGSSGTHGQGPSKPWSLEGHAPKTLAYCPWPSLGVRATGSQPAGPSHSFQRAGWILRAQPLPVIVREHREGHHLSEISISDSQQRMRYLATRLFVVTLKSRLH